jgi:hypothetical protein
VQHAFFVHVLPPEVFLFTGITKEDDTPRSVVRAFPEVCGIDDEVDRSWTMCFLWNDNRINKGDQCFLVVTGAFCEFSDRLFVENISEPKIVVLNDPSFVAETPPTFFATIRLYSIFDPLFNRLTSSAIRAKVPFF